MLYKSQYRSVIIKRQEGQPSSPSFLCPWLGLSFLILKVKRVRWILPECPFGSMLQGALS